MDYVLENMINEIIEELEDENKRKDFQDNVDIPFMMAALIQSLETEPCKYSEMISDLHNFAIHSVHYLPADLQGYAVGKIEISLQSNDTTSIEPIDNTYEIEFLTDERLWGYCECEPEDKDYREDKNCCGHGCDWDAPMIKVSKKRSICQFAWVGEEHDYWNFEDKFYAKRKALAEKKKENDKESEIAMLQEQIKELQQRLVELIVN